LHCCHSFEFARFAGSPVFRQYSSALLFFFNGLPSNRKFHQSFICSIGVILF